MAASDDLARENAALRERLARLSEAGLRVAEDLDLDTVLREVLDAARSLTGASLSSMTMLDGAGGLRDFITFSLSDRDHQSLLGMPNGPEFFGYLHGLEAPLRVDDLSAHVAELGLGPFPLPLRSFLGVPMRYRGEPVGGVYLAEKQGGGGFSAEDEETLGVFAAQAAVAIANARRMRDEQRARADLETLLETSPVGVVLFDAPSGAPVSFNREARRLVDGLRDPGQSPEQLLETISYRRADGREISVAEQPLARTLGTGEAVRAEEIVLKAADGRRVSAIVNATPIRAPGGRVESVVVTLQDLAPLEDLQRLRAQFLAMVSHELRVPLSSIRGSAATLLKAGPGLDPAAAAQFHRIIEDQAERMEELITDLLDVARIESGQLALAPEPASLDVIADAARGAFLAGDRRHRLEIELPPDLPRVLADRRRVVQVLLNLFANAARHSPGAPVIRLSAERQDVQVRVTVADDGVGIAPERLPELFRSASAAAGGGPAAPPGAGLGLAICKGIVEAHGGRIWAESEGEGRGAQFHFTLPATEAPAPPAAPGTTEPARGKYRILCVDDDPQTLRHVRDVLEEAGYVPVTTGNPDAVRMLVGEVRPHLVLLDLMLPGTDGMELMEQLPELRERPVIFLSAYGGDERIARALELGADDYIVKPFSPTELVARIRNVLRRAARGAAPAPELSAPISWGALTLDHAEELVTLDGRPLKLTPLEYRLLVELARHAGNVRRHAELLPRVWGPAHPARTGAVRTLVKQLRGKLGDDAERPAWIFNEPRASATACPGRTGWGRRRRRERGSDAAAFPHLSLAGAGSGARKSSYDEHDRDVDRRVFGDSFFCRTARTASPVPSVRARGCSATLISRPSARR